MESVCRLCLEMDAPVFIVTGSPLQEVYENLTRVSLNSSHKPVVACLVCYWQLRKCHKLMTRSQRVDSLLTKILQSNSLINRELVSNIDRKAYKLENGLNMSPMEKNVFLKPEPNIKEEIKDEPFLYTDVDETESDQIINVRNIKFEIPEATDDEQDLLTHQGDVMDEDQEGITYIKEEIDIDEIKVEDFENIYEQQAEGPSAIKCESQRWTNVEGVQDNSTLQLQNDFTIRETDVEEMQTNEIPAEVERPFECGICRRRFKLATHLRLHLRTHADKKPFECEICEKRFCLQSHLKIHSKIHRPKKPFQCGICHRKLKHKVGLENHLRVHSGEKPFECAICQKSYKQKTDLVKHLRTHSGEKPFECAICKNRFNQRSTLNIHLRTHNGKKPFECATCQREYKHKTSLIIHLRSHSGEKPFECAICKTRFVRRCDLTVHLRRHTGEKPFECKICKKTFNQRSTLKGHLTTHLMNSQSS